MRQKVLFVAPELSPEAGGGGAVASWILQSLVTAYETTAIVWEAPDLAALDRKFGTSLAGSRPAVLTPSPAEKWLVDRIPDDSSHQRNNYLLRMAKRLRDSFAATIVCGLESDLGRPGIQYVHYPYLSRRSGEWAVSGDAPLASRLCGLLSGRVPPWMVISGYSFDRMRSNFTLTNSRWTLRQIGGPAGSVEVLYPPAPGDFPDVPWEQRESAFVCTGRLVPEKRHEWMADTIALVRREWPDLRLHICGSDPPGDYGTHLEELARRHGPWVRIHYDLSRRDLAARLSKSRYGIHARIDEHFGIAPAEMARAGCIPFVHSSGGQVEIVDDDPRLCFTTAEDAAAKILAVLRDARLQDELRSVVHRRSSRFTTEAFVRGLLGHVAQFISAGIAAPPGCRSCPRAG